MTVTVPHPTNKSALDRLTDAAAQAPVAVIEATSALLEHLAGGQPTAQIRQASMTRILHAVTDLAEHADAAAMAEAVGESSNYAVLLALLDHPEVFAALRPHDPLASARLRGLRSREAFLSAEGGTLTARQVADLLGITRQAVDNRRKRGKLIAVELGRRGYAYSAWQFRTGSALPGLDRVIAAFPETSAWALIAFVLNGNAWLGGDRPLDRLRNGQIDEVIAAASQYGEQDAA